jgi:FixJ family two-component response regulator
MSSVTPMVFVVDDDVSVRESLELLIESVGWRSRTFASAQEFLAYPAAQTGASCVVLDASLPAFNGLELRERLALYRPDVPVILISGYDTADARVRAVKAGAVAFLMKPLDAGAFLRAIEHAVGRSRATTGREGEG